MRHRGSVARVIMLAALMVSVLGIGLATSTTRIETAYACPSSAQSAQSPECVGSVWPYGHSWYIQSYGSGAVQALADTDASWVNYACSETSTGMDFMTVLDFGRPGKHNGSYSVFGLDGNWHAYSAVQLQAQYYITEWYNNTTGCPRLHLVIGTANDYECAGSDADCNISTAGQQFDALVHNLQTFVNGLNWNWQITVWVGDDLEAEWDQWSMTSNFINGIYAQESNYSWHPFLMDFGDANIEYADFQGNHWTYQNVYDASWGIGFDWPLPEIYWHTSGPGNITQWVNMYNSGSVNRYAGQVIFEGNIAECTEADTLPTGNCWTGNNRCEYSPENGYNLLATDVGQPNMKYTTNIQWPEDSHTGNNGC
ncbi:MAG TPA: hypothetical protein VH591_21930 [Ktedonobacterales bacterium]|jgi:hypothetical protein